jgi:hypothetical protein
VVNTSGQSRSDDHQDPGQSAAKSGTPRALDLCLALTRAASSLLFFVGINVADRGGKGIYPEQPPGVVVDEFAEYADEARVGAALLLFAAVLQLVFWGQLWSRLRPRSELLAVVAVGGGLTLTWLLLILALTNTAAAAAGEAGAGEAARTVTVLEWEMARLAAPGGCTLVAASTVAGLTHRTFPRWFSWTSLGMTAVLVLSLLPIGPAGLLASVSILWILLVSLVLAFGGGNDVGAATHS